jgi:hypothetical protein
MRGCTADADCIAAITRCCDCGATADELIGINRAHEDTYRAYLECDPGGGCDACGGVLWAARDGWAELRVECVDGTCEASVMECTDATDCLAGHACILPSAWASTRICASGCMRDADCRDGETCASYACSG